MEQELLDNLYRNLQHTYKYADKAQILYLILELKRNYSLLSYKYSVYVDIKRFIHFYLLSYTFKDYGYDCCNQLKILELLPLVTLKEQMSLLLFLKRILQKKNEDYEWVDLQICNTKQLIYRKNVLMWLLYYFSKSIGHMMLALFLMFFIVALVMLPACNENCILYEFEYHNVSDVFVVNHVINVLALFFGLDIGYKFVCLTPFSVFLYALSKLIFITIIVDFIYNKLKKEFSLW